MTRKHFQMGAEADKVLDELFTGEIIKCFQKDVVIYRSEPKPQSINLPLENLRGINSEPLTIEMVLAAMESNVECQVSRGLKELRNNEASFVCIVQGKNYTPTESWHYLKFTSGPFEGRAYFDFDPKFLL